MRVEYEAAVGELVWHSWLGVEPVGVCCVWYPVIQPRVVAVGLALVRRSALAESHLLAEGMDLEISTPAAFEAPPVGAGKGA